MTDTVTIRDLVVDPSMNTRILCGARGLTRQVVWAHSCELEDPANWLQPHELLMTVGICVPAGSNAQREFIASLADAKLAGITIGDHGLAPDLSRAFFEEAEKRSFPVLQTAAQTPFSALARMVASFNSETQSLGLLRLAKLYDVAGRRDRQEKRSGAPMGELFGTSLKVVDEATGCVVIGEGAIVSRPGRRYPLRTLRPSYLLLEDETALESLSLMHLSQVLEVDANELIQEAVESAKRGELILTRALAGRSSAGRELVDVWGQETAGYRVMSTEAGNSFQIPLRLALDDSPALTGTINKRSIIVAPHTAVPDVKRKLSQLDVRVGVSALHYDEGDLEGAIEEAVSEYVLAKKTGEQWREFRGEQVSLLSRSRTERARIVELVLGPLSTDDPKMVALRVTLFTFLDLDQRWNETAAALNLHRQSVVYRLERVEELTGRRIKSTKHLAEFWLARTSWEQFIQEQDGNIGTD